MSLSFSNTVAALRGAMSSIEGTLKVVGDDSLYEASRKGDSSAAILQSLLSHTPRLAPSEADKNLFKMFSHRLVTVSQQGLQKIEHMTKSVSDGSFDLEREAVSTYLRELIVDEESLSGRRPSRADGGPELDCMTLASIASEYQRKDGLAAEKKREGEWKRHGAVLGSIALASLTYLTYLKEAQSQA